MGVRSLLAAEKEWPRCKNSIARESFSLTAFCFTFKLSEVLDPILNEQFECDRPERRFAIQTNWSARDLADAEKVTV